MKIKTYKPRRRRPSDKKFSWKTILEWLKGGNWKILALKIIAGFFLLIFLYAWLFLPSVKDAAQLQFSESTIIYDRGALDPNESPNDHILYVIHGDENREFVPLEEISDHIKNATIAVEDEDFYAWYHIGFDVPALIKAVLSQLGIGPQRGGSTITQQLVKNTFLTSSKTYSRKFNELLLSIKMEMVYSKDEILEMYLNKIPYGSNANGIEAASRKIFGKSSRDLTLAESSILAGLPNRPTYFSPYGSNRDKLMGFELCGEETIVYGKIESLIAESEPEEKETQDTETPITCKTKLGRKDLVLNSLEKLELATPEAIELAKEEAKTIEFKQNRTDIKAPHFVFYIRQQLEEKYGKEFLQDGGLRIFTTLDKDLQTAAEEAIKVKSPLYKRQWNASNVAMTAIDPNNGEILAYVGGKNYFDAENDGQVDVLQSKRQPGSSFKPFTFAAAFNKGFGPGTPIFDVETDFGGGYRPQNFDGNFAGLVPARDSLNRSLNVPAVKLAHLASPQGVIDTAKNAGIDLVGTADQLGVSVGIGTAEVEPLSHINAYQVFVNNGKYYQPVSILEIRSANGKILESAQEPEANIGVSETSSALVRNILTDESTRPTTDDFDWNKLLQLKDYDNGAKTGTSNRIGKNPNYNPDLPESFENSKNKVTPGDSWTIGFTPHLVSGVWVGNNNGEQMYSGATGMTVAAPIWRAFMESAHTKLKEKFVAKEKGTAKEFIDQDYVKANGLVSKKINKYTGKIASEVTPPEFARDEIFAPSAAPIEFDNFAELPTAEQKTYFKSLLPNKPNWEAPVQSWLAEPDNYLFELLGVAKKALQEELEEMYSNDSKNKQQTSLINGNELVKVLSPAQNAKVPINSTFEFTLGINQERIRIKEVEISFNGLTQKLTAPYSAILSTKRIPIGTRSIKIVVTDEQDNQLERIHKIYLTREKLTYTKSPTIAGLKKTTGGINVETMFSSRIRPPEYLRLVVEDKRKNTIKQTKILNPTKFTSFFLPKTKGPLMIKLYSKFEGKPEEITSKRSYEFQ